MSDKCSINKAFVEIYTEFSLPPLSFSVPFGSHQEEGFGANQAQVHRHQFQDGSRSVPDPQGQDGLHGTPQEGRRQDHRVGCLNIFPIYGCISFHLTCNFRKYIVIFVNFCILEIYKRKSN